VSLMYEGFSAWSVRSGLLKDGERGKETDCQCRKHTVFAMCGLMMVAADGLDPDCLSRSFRL